MPNVETLDRRRDHRDPPVDPLGRSERPAESPPITPSVARSEVPQPAPSPQNVGVTEPPAKRRQRLRRSLFALLPLALIAGCYWYVVGGAVMSTDDVTSSPTRSASPPMFPGS
jgi:hypothetical protein